MKNLLLLHGALGNKEQFHSLAAALKDDFHIHALSFSGHGGRASTENHFSMEIFSRDIVDYLSEKKLSHIDVFGYSMGGYAALYLASHHPGKIKKIATLATKFNWSPEAATNEAAMLNPDVMQHKIPGFVNILKERHGEEQWKNVVLKTAEMMIEMGRKNPLTDADFKEIKIPVLLTRGDQDKMVTESETLHVHQLIPGSKTFTLTDTPHPFEKVDVNLLAEMIRKFIS